MDAGDAALSELKLRAHAESIRAQVRAGLELLGQDGALPLQLVMVDIASPDATPSTCASTAFTRATGTAPARAVAKR